MAGVLITGGCGFIGASTAIALRSAGFEVTCFDNLSRRGSELLLRRVQDHGCRFVHGDIRCPEDLARIPGEHQVLIECSAEPSVMAGAAGSGARALININLAGAVNCFELARERELGVLFLSSSRVYPYPRLNALRFRETGSRFEVDEEQPGVSARGVSVQLPLAGARSLYGATKLCGELLLQEYCAQYGVKAIINRCGVIAGPWQMGKVDQGVFTHWLAAHHWKRPLRYLGYGGQGKQVRDLLHVDDLSALLVRQVGMVGGFSGEIFNVGGGPEVSLSLRETTALCAEVTGNTLEVGSLDETRPADLRWYVTDDGDTRQTFGWKPTRGPKEILADTHSWMRAHDAALQQILGS